MTLDNRNPGAGHRVLHAVVLLSGGLDSATTLAIARSGGYVCHALSVSYGQRHAAELNAAARLAAVLGAAEHRVMQIDLAGIGGSALTDATLDVPVEPSQGIPATYVPARNTMLLALALGWAEVLEASDIFIGVNAVDYSGYPDCRPEFVEAFGSLARLATRAGIEGRPARARAAAAPDQGRHHPGRSRARGRLRADRIVLSGGRGGRRLRALRRLPDTPGGLRGGGCRRPDGISL